MKLRGSDFLEKFHELICESSMDPELYNAMNIISDKIEDQRGEYFLTTSSIAASNSQVKIQVHLTRQFQGKEGKINIRRMDVSP